MAQREWVPLDVDVSVPSMARTYDFMLGGAHNFAVDREVGERIERAMPGLRNAARVNRAFLGRVVRFMADQGIRQFLDIGSGIPTVANVHEVAQARDPECRVVYVDRDPVAVAHSELILAGNDRAAVLHADMRDPEGILSSPEVRGLIDLDQPVGLLMLLMLHWVPDESDPVGLMARYCAALAPGSHLAITHVSGDHQGEKLSEATDVIKRSNSPDQVTLRTHAQVTALFAGLELVEPGLVGCGEWRPRGPGDIAGEPGMNMLVYAGVGRKPSA
ncbi:SAM-dependent methyltransferase [Actinokineospora iranica]|uniref:S-adenosyl methyltransferase n=1 Tax=Actinokineospora iranica TaxID=1271860 RepID=A0A1G6S4P0_9PSEU|nr:SAM-dependent methyltransferase [Actinokineospora iranica]SDD11107.1 S-adenosyl methyltransferase [Actinokineospora iranica]